jgi:protein TonB
MAAANRTVENTQAIELTNLENKKKEAKVEKKEQIKVEPEKTVERVKSSVKFTAPVIKKDNLVKEEDEIKLDEIEKSNKAIGALTVEGNDEVGGEVLQLREQIAAPEPPKPAEENKVHDLVEQMPSFPGGNGELMKYLSRKLMFPPVAREMSVEADITVKFTVDKTGFVRAPQVVSVSSRSPLVTAEVAKAAKDGDEAAIETSRNYADAVEALKEEAIHVVRTMPRWIPGRQNGKRVDTSYTLPINFKLN